jgi:ABC-type multidrug transport system fused ATPase/permease subunit
MTVGITRPDRGRHVMEVVRLVLQVCDTAVRRQLALAVLLVGTGSALAALAPLALKALVDAAGDGTGGLPTATIALGACYVLALVGGRVLAEVRPLLVGQAEQRLYGTLKQRFYDHVLELPMAFHDRRRTGALVQCVHQASTGCQLLVVHTVSTVVPVVVELFTIAAVLAHLGHPLLLALFAVSSWCYLVIYTVGAFRLEPLAHAVSDASQDAQALLADSLLNSETIKTHGAERQMSRRFKALTVRLEQRWCALHRHKSRTGLLAAAVFAASATTTLLVAGVGLSRGSLSLGEFVLINLYVMQAARPIELLGSALRDLAQGLAFMRPLLDMLRLPSEARGCPAASPSPSLSRASACGEAVASPPHVACLPVVPATRDAGSNVAPLSVRFEAIRFAYDSRPAVLDGLDLHVPAGRSLAIVGPSGSGKSSLVRLLLRLYEPGSGQILLGNRPVTEMAHANLRAMIGWVPQDTVLFNDTIAANIAVGAPEASRADIERAARLARLDTFIESLSAGYDTPVGERGVQLSGGERQRVAIARAVLKRPRLYVFDEATSMLDSGTEADIVRNLREVACGSTSITIAHRLSTIVDADEIAVLDRGRIVERGPHASLLDQAGAYARLWRQQTGEHAA